MVSDIVQWGNHTTKLTWIPGRSKPTDFPFSQCYAVVFNEKGEILIINAGQWIIPGGTPENQETAQQTLERELIEEADVKVNEIELLGAQKVEFLDSHNPVYEQGDVFYQLRFVCMLKKLLPQTPDPDNGKVYERKFVNAKDVTNYVKWGNTGEALFKDAYDWFEDRVRRLR